MLFRSVSQSRYIKQGIYYVWADSKAWLRHSSTSPVTTTADQGVILNANIPVCIQINKGDYLAVLGDTGASGKLHFLRVRATIGAS